MNHINIMNRAFGVVEHCVWELENTMCERCWGRSIVVSSVVISVVANGGLMDCEIM